MSVRLAGHGKSFNIRPLGLCKMIACIERDTYIPVFDELDQI